MSKRIVLSAFIVVFIVLCVVFEIPGLLYSEVNTVLFVKEFDDPELFCKETELSQKVDKIKVLSYTKNYAQVYYITDNYQNAAVFNYKKVDGKWQYASGYYPWTDDGLTSNSGGPSAYWWYWRLREKYMPDSIKYRSKSDISTDDIVRHPEEPLTQK